MKKALITAINDYPGYINDLRGCVNDAHNWDDLFKNSYNFDETIKLLDSDATIFHVSKALNKLIGEAKEGDVLVWTYSGHGTSVPGARPDKPDGRGEALCFHDGLFMDLQIKEALTRIPKGVHMTVVSDSCHSGTVTRHIRSERFRLGDSLSDQPRYMPPQDDEFAIKSGHLQLVSRAFAPEESMVEILISGCKANQTSADAYLGGKWNGALSWNAINILRKDPNITYNEFYNRLRRQLPSRRFDQIPQLEGSDTNKDRLVFS